MVRLAPHRPTAPPDPSDFIWCVSQISAVLGALTTSTERAVYWSHAGTGDYWVTVTNRPGMKPMVELNPLDEESWQLAFKIIGLCAYHGYEWEAP